MTPQYAAGLIDGEGYIGISKINTARTYAIRVQVAMVTKGSPILSQAQRTFGGRITHRPPETEANAPKDVWVVDGQEAYDLLTQIRAHLLLKTDQADCAIQLWEAIVESRRLRGREHWNDELRRLGEMLKRRLQEGNRRGPQPPSRPVSDEKPMAIYRWGWWWEPEENLFGPVEYQGKMPTSGAVIAGRMYDRTLSETSPGTGLLPTPSARLGKAGQDTARSQRNTYGDDLLTAITRLRQD